MEEKAVRTVDVEKWVEEMAEDLKDAGDGGKFFAGPSPLEQGEPTPLQLAFVQGAAWWEFEKTGETMWPSDLRLAVDEAIKREKAKTLGVSFNPHKKGGG